MSDSSQSNVGSAEDQPDFDAVVIGAGFAGLAMLHRLGESGMTARLFEAGSDVGGTWYWNRYPGAACDSMSHVYSFAFSDDLLQEWSWSTRYPKQPEVLKYLGYVADRFDLRRHIKFDTRVTAAVFEEAGTRWRITTDDGAETTARFLITGVGCLSAAQIPNFPGRDRFLGETYHTGAWPHEGVDFSGKRVGVIGTGSSGIQVIPLIAEEADQLTVFQRTANYSIPARNRAIDPDWEREVKADYRNLREQAKTTPTGNLFWLDEQSALDVPAEERNRRFQEHWDEGGFKILFGGYSDLVADLKANETIAEFVRNKIRETVKDPETARKLVPTDHPIGTKRPPLDTNYFETYNRDNVTLVDLKAEPLTEITERGIRTDAREYELDAIVFATGFDAMTGALFGIDIRADDGAELKAKWESGPLTYLGIATAGFPNLFMITGPGSPSVLSNMPVSIEQHVDWIGDFLDFLRERDLDRVEAELEAEDEWTVRVREEANETLLPLANSWYVGANTPGKPRVVFPYTGGVGVYRQHCAEIAAAGYPGFKASSPRTVGAT
jgi:cation diffusion facilitator CzcD-associated flavoprotein CzcO